LPLLNCLAWFMWTTYYNIYGNENEFCLYFLFFFDCFRNVKHVHIQMRTKQHLALGKKLLRIPCPSSQERDC